MNQQPLKITYHSGDNKINVYLKMPSSNYHVVKKEIKMCLFVEHNQPPCKLRTYYIDEDHDEIEIVNQCDYEIFMDKCSIRQHLQVTPISMKAEEKPKVVTSTESSSASQQAKKPPAAAGSYDLAVHEHIACDACDMAPIKGFRYKCIQCRNYDLCENCESKHIHSEHMMVRLPTNNCPNFIISRRNSRRQEDVQGEFEVINSFMGRFSLANMDAMKQQKDILKLPR
ncbi:protein ref(2)P-like [Lucilia sericata]|uniref:protein ref(2)P-like n=1 Tax=Lucilia sericata TaxID=13632 RepID=UPI0018A80085|nr:protein ref(2)P-like [Lucilia sericata]